MKYTKEIKEYEEYLFQKELARNTIQVYSRQARLLLHYLDGQITSKKAVLEYKQHLLKQGRRVTSTNLYIVAVNSYLKYIGKEAYCIRTERIQRQQSLENVLSMAEYRKMLAYALESGREKYYYIIRVLVFTGIRVSELSFLTVKVLPVGKFVVDNKGKIRDVYLPQKLVEELRVYCHKQEITEGAIFRGNCDKAISRVAVYKMLIRMAEAVGIEKEKAHPHSFRHLFAVTYMRQYADLTELADLLGHSSLETTRIYTTTTVEEKRNRLNNLEF